MIDVTHAKVVKNILGTTSVEALTALFNKADGTPPTIKADRFRADNPYWLDVLDELENRKSLVECNREGNDYMVRCYALPLIEDKKAERILVLMQDIYSRLKILYSQYLNESLSLEILLDGINGEKNETLEALYYLSEGHHVWSGKTTGFPYSENSTLVISESVLRHKGFDEILAEYFEWHFINPQNESNSWVKQFNVEDSKQSEGFFGSSGINGIPEWYGYLDDAKKALISEVSVALNNNLSALPTIGLRTLIEIIMADKIGNEGGFAKKLQKFEVAGYITKNHAQLLDSVLDTGNAAAHRAHFPNKEDIRTCVDVVEHLMQGIYILEPKVKKLKDNTPKRK